jgi:hypothetical protein
MNTAMYDELVMEQRVNVTAMADIVHDLVAGAAAYLHDSRRLRERAEAAGLDAHECAALENLRARLCTGGVGLLGTTTSNWG